MSVTTYRLPLTAHHLPLTMPLLKNFSPQALGMPTHISSWRDIQAEAIEHVLTDESRFSALAAPVGMGKSAIGIASARAEGQRGLYLTFTKLLQRQLEEEFTSSGLRLIKGRANYLCAQIPGYSCEEAGAFCGVSVCPTHERRCHVYDCDSWAGKCPYKLDFQDAYDADLVCSNYAYWVNLQKYRADALNKFGVLILDEAHSIPEGLCSLLAVELTEKEIVRLRTPLPENVESPEQWRDWAGAATALLEAEKANLNVGEHSRRDNIRRAMELENLNRKLSALVGMSGDWVVERNKNTFSLQPVYAFQHAESRLFCGVRKVVLMSGTLTPKTLALLGIHPTEYDFHTYPYAFPVSQCPVYHVKTTRLRWDSGPEAEELVFLRAAKVLKTRGDRKGIVHTVSYSRGERFVAWLQKHEPDLARRVMTHHPNTTETTVSAFKASKMPRVIVSPSLTTGYDFPGPECEFVIWLKMPFPNMKTPVMAAREKRDRTYSGYLMMQELMQGSYRGMRKTTDWCEIFILDDTWEFAGKRYRSYVSPWFKARTVTSVPQAPPNWASRQPQPHSV